MDALSRRLAQHDVIGIDTADALHLATALTFGASAWVSNDRQHSRLVQMDVILLDEFLS
jgi:predicted nucleic acid-binding protein